MDIVYEISYKLYCVFEEQYVLVDECMSLNGLFMRLQELRRSEFKRFLIIQKINDGECPTFAGYNNEDIKRFKSDAFIPYENKKCGNKEKVKTKKYNG